MPENSGEQTLKSSSFFGKRMWYKLALSPGNVLISLILAFSAVLAFIQGFAQNLRIDPPKVEHLQTQDIEAIEKSTTSRYVGDQWFYSILYYFAGLFNVLTMLRVIFVNTKVASVRANKKAIPGSWSLVLLRADAAINEINFNGKYFWHELLISLTFDLVLQIIRFLSFSGFNVAGSPSYVEVKKPFCVISYSFVIATHLMFMIAMFFTNRKMLAATIAILFDFYYALVPLMNIHGSIFDPYQWYTLRNLNALEMLAGVAPLLLKCGTLQYVSKRHIRRLVKGKIIVVRRNIHKELTKGLVAVVCTVTAAFLLIFTLVKHFGADCKPSNISVCHRWVHPIFDKVSCDCLMLAINLRQEEDDQDNSWVFSEMDRFSRVKYLTFLGNHKGEEVFRLMRSKFIWLESFICNYGELNNLRVHHHDKLSVYISEGQQYDENFDWSLLKTLPNLKFASFSFSRIPHWPALEDVKHIETLLVVNNPLCSQERPPELASFANLKCIVDKVFDVDERCNKELNAHPTVAELRERCDKYFQSGASTKCIAPCYIAQQYIVDQNEVFNVDVNGDNYYSIDELRFALRNSGSFGEVAADDEAFICVNQNNKGCPAGGDDNLLAFTTLTVYITNSGSNCLDCDWAHKRLQEIEGVTTSNPASESTTALPIQMNLSECPNLLNHEPHQPYQGIMESCSEYEAKGKPQDCLEECNEVLRYYGVIDVNHDGDIDMRELNNILVTQDLVTKPTTDSIIWCLAKQLGGCSASVDGPSISFEAVVVYSTNGNSGCRECPTYPAHLML